MQLRYLMLLTALTFSGAAIAADTGERTSQVDKNSKCMDRTTDSSSGDCVVKDEGTPRHLLIVPQIQMATELFGDGPRP